MMVWCTRIVENRFDIIESGVSSSRDWPAVKFNLSLALAGAHTFDDVFIGNLKVKKILLLVFTTLLFLFFGVEKLYFALVQMKPLNRARGEEVFLCVYIRSKLSVLSDAAGPLLPSARAAARASERESLNEP